jgi:hypothetical protein
LFVVFPCLNLTRCVKHFYIFVNSDVWNRSITKLSSEFMLVFLVGSPFSMCIIQTYRMLQWCLHCNWRLISYLQSYNNPYVTDWVLVAWWAIQFSCSIVADTQRPTVGAS